jgi:hypothetical protein
MINMQKLRRHISAVLFASIGLLVVMISPLYVSMACISIMAFVAIARQMNFLSRINMMRKNYAKTVSKLRFEIRAKLHTGYANYSDSVESERSSHRSSGFVR